MTTTSNSPEVRSPEISLANRLSGLLAGFAAFLLGVALPTATSFVNIALVLIIICLIIQRDRLQFKALATNPIVYLPAVMFLLLAASLLFHHNDYGSEMVGKMKKLLYVLPLALFFLHQNRLIKLFGAGFLLANAVILAGSLLVGVLHVPLGAIDPANPTIFKLQITQNFFMALAAVLWLMLAFKSSGWKRLGYGVLVAGACYSVLFLVLGRTGYVALVVGLGSWLFFSLGNRQRLGLVALGIIAFAIIALVPNRATDRIMLGVNEIKACMASTSGDEYQACNSSMGQRSAFAMEAARLIKQAPIMGNGAGGFFYSNPETGYKINNPHNQYLLETIQSGILGLVIFLAWIVCCFRAAWQQDPKLRNLLLALLCSYMACNFFNSFLLDYSEGHLFMILAAILAGYSVSAKQNMPQTL
ncbi:putative O-antigen biosynthesis protein [Yersinia nurmii]|uniref:O-antigen biosynthesis protein n=1 Tax=Yersinia nurmii TaxID=685706 RepID=A0ABM9SJ74_9GAMM|nr:O-antigen ligase family protein [Yersinia nurmii]CNE74101.1 putative O-antigen biosynthesis protein [Yersinia nurmii]